MQPARRRGRAVPVPVPIVSMENKFLDMENIG
jgi:hypothetical protein